MYIDTYSAQRVASRNAGSITPKITLCMAERKKPRQRYGFKDQEAVRLTSSAGLIKAAPAINLDNTSTPGVFLVPYPPEDLAITAGTAPAAE